MILEYQSNILGALGIIAGILFWPACTFDSTQTDQTEPNAEVVMGQLASTVRGEIARGGTQKVGLCGDSVKEQQPHSAIFVSSYTCWSCSDLGYLARHSEEIIPESQQPVALAAVAMDSAKICSYLRKERVNRPVIPIAIPFRLREYVAERLVWMSLQDEGSRMVIDGSNAIDIEQQIEILRTDSAETASR